MTGRSAGHRIAAPTRGRWRGTGNATPAFLNDDLVAGSTACRDHTAEHSRFEGHLSFASRPTIGSNQSCSEDARRSEDAFLTFQKAAKRKRESAYAFVPFGGKRRGHVPARGVLKGHPVDVVYAAVGFGSIAEGAASSSWSITDNAAMQHGYFTGRDPVVGAPA